MTRFHLLGRVGVGGPDSVFLPAQTPMMATMLSVLELHSGHVSRDTLIASLWDDPASSAEANLRKYLIGLRGLLTRAGLGDRLVVTRANNGFGATYRLVRDRPEVDYERFLDLAAAGSVALSAGRPQTALPSLRHALALWHGEAGAGIRMTNRLARRLAGLNERHLLAQEDFLTALVETGDASGALAQVQSILAGPDRYRGSASGPSAF